MAGDNKQLLAEIAVGKEPRNVAIAPDGKRVFVANAGADTLSVIETTAPYAHVADIKVGTEPYGLAFTPNGKKLYVANARTNTVSVVDPVSYTVVETITGVGQEPRGIAITNDGDDKDDDEKVYVTQFFGVDRAGVFNGSIAIGADDYKEGRVAVIATATDQVTKQAVLEPLADSGFKSNGSALQRIAPKTDAAGKPVFDVVTGAFPNMLQSVVIKGNRAYLPNTCASPDAPVRFNVNVQSCLSVLDTTTDVEGKAGGVAQTINMNRGINFEVGDPADERKRLFLAVPWAVAFKNDANEGYAASMSSNAIVKVVLDADGTPSINAPKQAGDPGAIVRILVGQSPRGIVINSGDTRAYVANENSRDVSVIDLATDSVLQTFASAPLPAAGSDDAKRLIGKAVFDSSTGVDLAALSSPALSGVVQRFPARLSNEGWGSCVACHGFGRTDNVVWMFGAGPRRSVPLHWSFNPVDADDIRALNHSAINNDIQDFESNIRDVSGGLGLIVDAAGNQARRARRYTATGCDQTAAGGRQPRPQRATRCARVLCRHGHRVADLAAVVRTRKQCARPADQARPRSVRCDQLRLVPRRCGLGFGAAEPARRHADDRQRRGCRGARRCVARGGHLRHRGDQRDQGQRHHRGRRTRLQSAVAARRIRIGAVPAQRLGAVARRCDAAQAAPHRRARARSRRSVLRRGQACRHRQVPRIDRHEHSAI